MPRPQGSIEERSPGRWRVRYWESSGRCTLSVQGTREDAEAALQLALLGKAPKLVRVRRRRSKVRQRAPSDWLTSPDHEAEELKSTAYHEAGHAIICTVLGGSVVRATIRPTYGLKGHVKSSRLSPADRIIEGLAGWVAQRKYLREAGWWSRMALDDRVEAKDGAAHDIANARRLLVSVSRFNDGEASLPSAYLRRQREIFDAAWARTVLLVRRHWDRIAALAEILLEKETAKSDDIDWAMSRPHRRPSLARDPILRNASAPQHALRAYTAPRARVGERLRLADHQQFKTITKLR
jgi:hypothetical protein